MIPEVIPGRQSGAYPANCRGTQKERQYAE